MPQIFNAKMHVKIIFHIFKFSIIITHYQNIINIDKRNDMELISTEYKHGVISLRLLVSIFDKS